MTTMFDSVALAIPADAKMILAYKDGPNNYAAAVAKFPNALIIPTTTIPLGNPTCIVYDCEPGNGTATDFVEWAVARISLGFRPCCYTSKDDPDGHGNYGWEAVKGASALGKITALVDYGIADWTGHPHLLPGTVFTQYANPATSGGNYDLSLTNNLWPYNITIKPNPLPVSESNMPAPVELSNGKVLITAIGEGTRAGQLLYFIVDPANPATPPSVIDVTDQIGGNPPYTVSA